MTHMQASIINLYFGFYAFMCVWSFRLTECETMIWVITMTAGGIISVAYTCVLLRRIRSSNDGSSYEESETTTYKICSFRLYGFVSTGTWIENVTKEYLISNAYYLVFLYCICVSHQILILHFLSFVSKPIVTLIPIQNTTIIPNSLNAISERSCVIMYSRWTAFGCGLRCVLLCHLLCARRGFYGIRIVAVTGCRELIIWQRVTSCMCSQIRIEKQICISVLSAICLLYTSPSPRDRTRSRMPSSA